MWTAFTKVKPLKPSRLSLHMLCTLVCDVRTSPYHKSKIKESSCSKLFCTFANHYLCTNLKYLVVVYHNAISEEGGHDHVTATAFQGQEVSIQAKQCSKVPSTFSSVYLLLLLSAIPLFCSTATATARDVIQTSS